MSSRCWVVLGILTGCDPAASTTTAPDPGTGSDTGPSGLPACLGIPGVEIGTGGARYEPLSEGQPLEVTFGPQGGWHLTTAVRLSAISSIARLHPSATVIATGEEIAGLQLPENRELSHHDPVRCTAEALDLRAFLSSRDPQEICPLQGEPLTIRVEVTDLTTQLTAVGERTVIAALDPVTAEGCTP